MNNSHCHTNSHHKTVEPLNYVHVVWLIHQHHLSLSPPSPLPIFKKITSSSPHAVQAPWGEKPLLHASIAQDYNENSASIWKSPHSTHKCAANSPIQWHISPIFEPLTLIQVGYQAKGGTIYPSTAYLCAETLYIYIWYGFGKYSKLGLTLNHDVTTSDRSVPTPSYLKTTLDSGGVSG